MASTGAVFVIGAQGSGTTVMRLILDSHDDLAIAQETGFARALLANEWIPFSAKVNAEWYSRIGMTRNDLEREIGRAYDGMFGRWAKEQGARRWGDKTPYHIWHMELLARVFPDAVFVGMVRHPGAGASSRTTRMGHAWAGSVRHWERRNVEMLHQGTQLGERFVLCRYEELVTEPEPVLRELVDWLGETWSDRLLTFNEVHKERGTPSQVEGWTHSDDPLDTSRVHAWTRSMDEPRWARLRQDDVRTLAGYLGYDVELALPSPGWGAVTSSRLLDGHGLLALRDERPGVDWTHRPRPSLPNRPLRPNDLKRLPGGGDATTGGGRTGGAGKATALATSAGRGVLHALPSRPRRTVRSLWWRLRAQIRDDS